LIIYRGLQPVYYTKTGVEREKHDERSRRQEAGRQVLPANNDRRRIAAIYKEGPGAVRLDLFQGGKQDG
jgi:hypothetical protein